MHLPRFSFIGCHRPSYLAALDRLGAGCLARQPANRPWWVVWMELGPCPILKHREGSGPCVKVEKIPRRLSVFSIRSPPQPELVHRYLHPPFFRRPPATLVRYRRQGKEKKDAPTRSEASARTTKASSLQSFDSRPISTIPTYVKLPPQPLLTSTDTAPAPDRAPDSSISIETLKPTPRRSGWAPRVKTWLSRSEPCHTKSTSRDTITTVTGVSTKR